MLTLATADYAAVSATVDQVTRRRGAGAGKFTNAVLRAVAADPGRSGATAWWRAGPSSPVDRGWSHPAWIIRAFTDALTQQGAETEIERLLERNDEPAPVTLAARPGRITQAALLAATDGAPGDWSPWSVRITGDPGRFPDIRSGAAGSRTKAANSWRWRCRASIPRRAGGWTCAPDRAVRPRTWPGSRKHRGQPDRGRTAPSPGRTRAAGDQGRRSRGRHGRGCLSLPLPSASGSFSTHPARGWERSDGVRNCGGAAGRDLPALRSAQTRLVDRAGTASIRADAWPM